MFYHPFKQLLILGALLWSCAGSAEFVQNSVNLADMCNQDLSFKRYNQSLCAEALARSEDNAIVAPLFLSCLHPHFREIESLCPADFVGAVDLPDIPYERDKAPVWPQDLDSLFTSMLGSSLAASTNLKVHSAFGEIIYDEQIIADLCNEEEEFAKTDLLLCAPHVSGLKLIGPFKPSLITQEDSIKYGGPFFEETTVRAERYALRDAMIGQLKDYIELLNKKYGRQFDLLDFKTSEIEITVSVGTRYPEDDMTADAFLDRRIEDLARRLKNGFGGNLIDAETTVIKSTKINNSVEGCPLLATDTDSKKCLSDEYGTVTVKTTFQFKEEL